jgi:phosphoserine phosphatase
LGVQGLTPADVETRFYSDSINDLPLLNALDPAAAVDPDPRPAQHAAMRGWPIVSLR